MKLFAFMLGIILAGGVHMVALAESAPDIAEGKYGVIEGSDYSDIYIKYLKPDLSKIKLVSTKESIELLRTGNGVYSGNTGLNEITGLDFKFSVTVVSDKIFVLTTQATSKYGEYHAAFSRKFLRFPSRDCN